jgi:hypothetical protein
LRRNLVFANVLVGKLDGNFEFDRNEIVAANLAGAAGGDEVLDAVQPFFASQRFTRACKGAAAGATTCRSPRRRS